MNEPRPWWMTLCAAVCLAALVWTVPRDLFFAETRDVEVWLGFEARGTLALATAPIHWLIFAVGAYGFWTRRPWILPLATGYVFYVALSHLVWSEASANGNGWPIGLVQALGIALFGVWLLRLQARAAPSEPGG